MSKPTVSKLLLTSFVTIALAGAPKPAFGQHNGRGSHGGGASHSSGSRGGGRLRSGGGGFHLGRGLFGGKGFGRGLSASPRQRNGGSSRSFGRSGSRPKSNSAYVGGRSGRSNRPPITGSTSRSWSRQAQSSWANPPRSAFSFSSNRPPAAGSASRSWSRQTQSSWANPPRSAFSFNSNRPPAAGSASRSWSRQAQSSWANPPRSASSFNSNRPPAAGSASRSWSRQAQSSWASLSRSRLSFNPNRRLSNSRNSRFGNSAFGHSSFSNSRVGSSVPVFRSSQFAGAHHFDSSADSFNRESSFDGGDFSFIPDLFGLALNLGGFGLRGLALLGSSLASFSLNAGLESRQWGPGSPFYSAQNRRANH
jgi:hypothetical protein